MGTSASPTSRYKIAALKPNSIFIMKGQWIWWGIFLPHYVTARILNNLACCLHWADDVLCANLAFAQRNMETIIWELFCMVFVDVVLGFKWRSSLAAKAPMTWMTAKSREKWRGGYCLWSNLIVWCCLQCLRYGQVHVLFNRVPLLRLSSSNHWWIVFLLLLHFFP